MESKREGAEGNYSVTRYHDFSAGHRVVGHENKCRFLHGHNYRVHFCCQGSHLDRVGRVVDFGVIKSHLCAWIEQHWDHRLLLSVDDPILFELDPPSIIRDSIVRVPFNPTAENMARYLVDEIGPRQLATTGVRLISVLIEETRKCSAQYHAAD